MNYVVTKQKPTSVSHSCVGHFTDPQQLSLVVGKYTRIEIHLLTLEEKLETIIDVPIYGRIASLEFFRPQDEEKDLLFVAIERYKAFVLTWDSQSSELRTRYTWDVSDRMGRPADCGQIFIIDPDSKMLGLHLYEGWFKVIPFECKGQTSRTFNIRLKEMHVLDIKFLFGCEEPTIAVLYQDKNYACHVKTYKVSQRDYEFVKGPWSKKYLDTSANLLIPLHELRTGTLVIGEEIIYYCSAEAFHEFRIKQPITKAYGRVAGSKYLLGDKTGLIYLLEITHAKSQFTDLSIELLGTTSIASTISCLHTDIVFVGSNYGDSKLIKLNLRHEKDSRVEYLESYINLGPIVDFCLLDHKIPEQGQLVTCSGGFKDGSLRIFSDGLEIKQQMSVDLNHISAMWALEFSAGTFLVVKFVSETLIIGWNAVTCELRETEINGFLLEEETKFCGVTGSNQLVQVTSHFVRLVDVTSGELRCQWVTPTNSYVTVATANASQVLLACARLLVCLEIGDGTLTEVGNTELEYQVSCLDIHSGRCDLNSTPVAAVGRWKEVSVNIYVLPELTFVTRVLLEDELVVRSVLFCEFEEGLHLLCGCGAGSLFNFQVDEMGNPILQEKVLLGNREINLRTFLSNGVTHVFATSDRAAVIYSKNKKLRYSKADLKVEVNHMCSFNRADLPFNLAFSTDSQLIIATTSTGPQLSTIPIGEQARCICYQEETKTLAICQQEEKDTGKHIVRLLDGQSFAFMSIHQLDPSEYGCSILSCSFADDKAVYYCVGTAYILPQENQPSQGRILVFAVKERKLWLIAEEKTEGAVYSLKALEGKLLAAVNQRVVLYNWIFREDGSSKLQYNCSRGCPVLAVCLQTRGNLIVVGDLINSISVFIYKNKEGKIEQILADDNEMWMSAVEILNDQTFLGADNSFNLFTVKKKDDECDGTRTSRMEVVGCYHVGECVNRFCHGSLVKHGSEMDQTPMILFGTISGLIGLIASLPLEQYVLLENLQNRLRGVIKGVGDLSHEQWRSFRNGKRNMEAKSFLDGDLIEMFLGLSERQKEEIASGLNVQVKDLCEKVEELAAIH